VGVVPGTGVVPAVQAVVSRSVRQPVAPLAMALVVVLFLLLQHRIDRRDPKLARDLRHDPTDLEFGSAITVA
jgi:hypothetical protein